MRVTHRQSDMSGFLPDPAPDTLPSGAINAGHNVKPTIRGWEKSMGYRESSAAPTNERNYIKFWSPAQGDNRWFSCGDTTIQQVEGNSVTDVSRVGGYNSGGAHRWNGVDFNGVLVMNNVEDSPQYLTGAGVFEDLPNLDAAIRFRDIAVYKSYLVGLGSNLGTGFIDDEVYWSHPADAGTVPPNWDYADPTSDSGRSPIPSEGYCVTALELADSLVIYKSDSIWLMQFIGGQSIFSFKNKFPGQGVMNKHCVVDYELGHFVVTQNDVIVHDGFNVRSVVDKRVRDFFFDNLNPAFFENAFVIKNPRFNEIMIFFPSYEADEVEGYCDSCLVWDWRANIWEFRKVPDITSASFGYEILGADITWETYSSPWERSGSWQGSQDVAEYATVLHYASNQYAKLLTPSFSNLLVTEPIEAILERHDCMIGTISRDGVPRQDYERMKVISRLSFDTDSDDTFDVYLGTRDSLDESITWELAGTVDPRQDKRLDVVVTCAFLSYRIVTNAARFNLRNITIYYEFAGEIW